MNRATIIALVSLAVVVFCATPVALTYFFQWGEPNPATVDPNEASNRLDVDLNVMWETTGIEKSRNSGKAPGEFASTDRAINAASRVFNSIELKGHSRDEVIEMIGDPKNANNSKYNFPFWPAPQGALVYRFDSGAYGWQFNVVLGLDGKVTDVQRHWIH